MKRTSWAVLIVGLSACRCLLESNPAFIESDDTESMDAGASDAGETGPIECTDHQLDCDATPGCESLDDDPMSCGDCEKQCWFDGVLGQCMNGVCFGSVTVSIDSDAHVAIELPDQNFGDDPTLRVDPSHDVFLELPDLGALPDGATIDSVSLHLDCVEAGATVELHAVKASWSEADLTYANAPAIQATVLVSITPEVGQNEIELIDLISWKQGEPKRSLALRQSQAASEGPVAEFVSSEGDAGPTLIVTSSW